MRLKSLPSCGVGCCSCTIRKSSCNASDKDWRSVGKMEGVAGGWPLLLERPGCCSSGDDARRVVQLFRVNRLSSGASSPGVYMYTLGDDAPESTPADLASVTRVNEALTEALAKSAGVDSGAS